MAAAIISAWRHPRDWRRAIEASSLAPGPTGYMNDQLEVVSHLRPP